MYLTGSRRQFAPMKILVTNYLRGSLSRRALLDAAVRALCCWLLILSVIWGLGQADLAGAGPSAVLGWLLEAEAPQAPGILDLTFGVGFWGASAVSTFGLAVASWGHIAMGTLIDRALSIPRLLIVCYWLGVFLWAAALFVVQAHYSKLAIPTFYETVAIYGLISPFFLALAICAFALFDSPIRD